jgi:hypothetical protein
MFQYRAAFVEPPRCDAKMPPVRVTLPDGTVVTSDQADLHDSLSRVLGREVTLEAAERGQREAAESSFRNRSARLAEEYWPDLEGLDHRDTVTDFDLPQGTFFDCAVLHVLTTATLDRLRVPDHELDHPANETWSALWRPQTRSREALAEIRRPLIT